MNGDDTRKRSRSDDRHDSTLPVTAEVGSEGGSFADPTYQVATFGGDDARPASDDRVGPPPVAGEATDFDAAARSGIGAGPDPAAGMVRYPTEPPAPPSAAPGREAAAPRWRTKTVAAAVGAAGVALAMALRHRRTSR